MQNIPGWTYKGRWWQRFGWRNAAQLNYCTGWGIKDHKDDAQFLRTNLDGECQKV